jgi:cytochrome P450
LTQHVDGHEIYDPFNPVVDPYIVLERAHARCPVFPGAGNTMIVTGADNVAAVFKDVDSFRNQIRHDDSDVEPSLVHLDGAAHVRLRKLVVKAFTPRAVKRLEEPTYEIANALIDGFLDRGNTDLCAEFAFQLPAMVIAALVGIPPGDRSMFVEWADDAITASMIRAGYADSDGKLRDYVTKTIERRRAEPEEDLLSGLIEVHDGGDRLTTGELVSLVRHLIVAGTDTTANLIGSMMHFLLSERHRWERLLQDRSLIPNVIEETLRFDPPLSWIPRVAAYDVELAGQSILEGTLVCNSVGHANRDPDRVERPNEWDMDRPADRTRAAHQTFGFGEHFCVGSALARLEATVVLNTLLERMPDIRLADSYEYRPHGPAMMRGVMSMPVEFAPNEAGATNISNSGG